MRSVRVLLTTMVGMAGSLVAYGAVYNHFRPHAGIADPALAYRMVPLELLFGLLMGWWVFQAFGNKLQAAAAPRADIQERMLFRLLARKRKITLQDIRDSSPLSEQDAQQLLQKWMAEGKIREVGQQEFVLN
ncbi:hypothetical protein [Deinococcus roseus]|uniref:MarR family transcriptional regulator n=1 Tax=Deinococcus roseus TaxID=392414 RepID=A0ABQ2CSX8_9DEIO|nr:hypothetical protein [Deinococcus roseus]GGJ17969.1 hypothetical protein GCM10008938_00070 [Deinococcus roseus]